METVLFGYFFFRAYATVKFKLCKRKKIKKEKVWSWYKTNKRGKHVCLEKAINLPTGPTFFSDCVCLLFFCTATDCKL